METSIQKFTYEGKEIRTTHIGNEPWWVANDICNALGIKTPRIALRRIDSDDVCQKHVEDSAGRRQLTNVVNESGLYALILGSEKPEARVFKRWVTKELLPEIRKNGAYISERDKQSIRQIAEGYIRAESELALAQIEIILKTSKRMNMEDVERMMEISNDVFMGEYDKITEEEIPRIFKISWEKYLKIKSLYWKSKRQNKPRYIEHYARVMMDNKKMRHLLLEARYDHMP